MPECRDTNRDRLFGGTIRVDRVETRDDAVEQPSRVVLDTPVGCDGRRVLYLVRAPDDRPARGVVERGPDRRGPDVQRDDHCVKIAPMAESWEVLTLRGLAATDERAEQFTGTLVIHRLGSPEPVESVSVSIKRTVLAELHENLGRLLARSTGIKRRSS